MCSRSFVMHCTEVVCVPMCIGMMGFKKEAPLSNLNLPTRGKSSCQFKALLYASPQLTSKTIKPPSRVSSRLPWERYQERTTFASKYMRYFKSNLLTSVIIGGPGMSRACSGKVSLTCHLK